MSTVAGIAGAAAGAPGLGALPAMPTMPSARDQGAGATADVTGFEGLITRAVSGLSETLETSDRMSELAATGELSDPTTAILAAEEADLAMQMAVQVRNRMLQSWTTINQMSV
jgi:flagellar hook-basal body complex protein FliE